MQSPSNDPQFASNSRPSLELVTQQFLDACQNQGDRPPPRLEVFLAPFAEPELSIVRAQLEEIQKKFARSSAAASHEGEYARGTNSDRTIETKQNEPKKVEAPYFEEPGTVEHVAVPDDTAKRLVTHGRAKLESSAVTGEFVGTPNGLKDRYDSSNVTGDFTDQQDGTLDHYDSKDKSGEFDAEVAETAAFALREKAAERQIPKTVAGYEVLEVLGRGAMGVVYKARQRGLKRLVALKMILSGEHASAQDLARFQAEADAVAQLHHAGIVQIYEIGEDEGRPFFSLEFVDGTSLHKKLQEAPMSPKESAAMLHKMALAMAYAHERGVIHRDLKPANILLTSDGLPKIGDFGLAKSMGEHESGLTQTGTVMGTPSYMSPEQGSGLTREIGPLSDVYSLGAILYDMLTGRPPFRGTSVMDTLEQLRTREPVSPVQLQPGVPRDLETICMKCLQKDRNKRYADAGAMAADLRRFLNGEPILARPISNAERLWRWGKRNKFKAATAAGALLSAMVITVLLVAVVVTVLVFNQKLSFERNEAVVAKNVAVEQTTIAKQEKENAEKAEIEANRQKEIAVGEKIIAVQQTDKQRDTAKQATMGMIQFLKKMYNAMQSKRLAIDASSDIKKMRANILKDIRNSVENVRRKIDAVASDTFTEQLEAEQVALMLMQLGQTEEPREILEKARKSLAMRVDKDPTNVRARANLGIMEQHLGDVALDLEGDARRALKHFLTSRTLHEENRLRPMGGDFKPNEHRWSLGHDNVRVAKAYLALGQAEKAKPFLDEALKYYTEWRDASPKNNQIEPNGYIFQTQMLLGIYSSHLGDAKGVQDHFDISLGIGRALIQAAPNYPDFKIDNAEAAAAYGDSLLRVEKTTESQKQYLASLSFLNEFYAKQPDDIAHLPLLALANERLGIVGLLLNQEAKAKEYNEVAMRLRKELWDIEQSNVSRHLAYVVSMARAGEIEQAMKECATLRAQVEKSTELMLQVARCFAICARTEAPEKKTNIEQAMTALVTATNPDFKDATVLLADPDLSILREVPEFKALIAKIKAR